eukprot:5051569-Amphidinium_carterae.1
MAADRKRVSALLHFWLQRKAALTSRWSQTHWIYWSALTASPLNWTLSDTLLETQLESPSGWECGRQNYVGGHSMRLR